MNYLEYMEKVQILVNQLSESEKAKWIQQFARTQKSEDWEDVLKTLQPEASTEAFQRKEFLEWCQQVTTGRFYYEVTENDYYYDQGDSWDDSEMEDCYQYEDNDKINALLDDYYREGMNQLQKKAYSEARWIFEKLLELSFTMKNPEEQSIEKITLFDIFELNLLGFSEEALLYPFLYTIFQTEEGDCRMNLLYHWMTDLTLEKIFSIGPEELPSIELFLTSWIDFLQKIESPQATRLLIEGGLLVDGLHTLKEVALREGDNHPGLYIYLCQELFKDKSYEEVEKFGLLGLNKIENQSKLRGEIASITAQGARALKHINVYQECLLEAFYADMKLASFFPLIEWLDDLDLKSKVRRAFENQKQISLSSKEQQVVRFFLGEFYVIFDWERNDLKHTVYPERRVDLYLLLFLLYPPKCSNLITDKLIQLLYSAFSGRKIDPFDFEDYLFLWKRQQKIPNEEKQSMMAYLHRNIGEIAEEIVGGGIRKHYGEVALFVSILGEVDESKGLIDGRKQLISKYQKKYASKRAFKGELLALEGK